MTVKELIAALEEFLPETKVVVRGYENGFNDVVSLRKKTLMIHEAAKWYDGRYIETNRTESIIAVELFGDNQIPVS